MHAVTRDSQITEWEYRERKKKEKARNRESIQVCIPSVCFRPQLRESTLQLAAVGQAASTLDCFPDAEYSHSSTTDVGIR